MRRRLLRRPADWIGFGVLAFVLLVGLLGPFFAPHSPTLTVGIPAQGPTSSMPLGGDFLGRDVLSRLLWGGRSVLWLGGAATFLGYLVGVSIGLIAGYTRSFVDPVLMRTVDLILAFPALLILLVLVEGSGGGTLVLVLGVALVQVPGIARVVRSATLEVSVSGFVEAAIARGESTFFILRREILPNILGPIVATVGLRFSLSIILIASVNFLGLGLQPPASDWGLMVSENRQFISVNPWSVLAPAAMLALLTISMTMVGDTIARSVGSSSSASVESATVDVASAVGAGT